MGRPDRRDRGEAFAEAEVAGSPRLNLLLAVSPDEWERGLMNHASLAPDQGMLFVFDRRGSGAFWNVDTLVPLSIAFIEQDGTIVDIQDMRAWTPGAEPDVCRPAAPYRFAIEANQGWFVRHGVSVGDRLKLTLPPR